MSLIKCPECGKEISDKANNCVHCGYPINREIKIPKYESDCPVCGKRDFQFNEKTGLLSCKNCGCVVAENKTIHDQYAQEYQQQNPPVCPTCGSTNIEKYQCVRRHLAA